MATNLTVTFILMNVVVLMAICAWLIVKPTIEMKVWVKHIAQGNGSASGRWTGVSPLPSAVRNISSVNNPREPPLILLWNSFFSVKDYHVGVKSPTGRVPLEHCDVRCDVSRDKSLFVRSAAIIIHGRNGVSKMPATRQPWQRVVFLLLEPPAYDPPYRHLSNVVNTTMTYRRDSDVFIATSTYVMMDSWKPARKDYVDRNYTEGKSSEGVFWMVSNCHPKSKRDVFVTHLKKHINVDIYGKCAAGKRFNCDDFSCTKEANKYKFHIAFENSLCKGYAQKILKPYDSIPIVMGGENYTAVLPPNSYVDIKDFGSPKELADHLHAIAKNDTWFSAFFEYRKHYGIFDFFNYVHHRRICKLCQALVHKTLPTTKVYNDLHSWWHKDACWTPQVYYPRLKDYF